MEVYVKDYDFVHDISALFQKKIIIYGAGYRGRQLKVLLDGIGIELECFCDKDRNKEEYLNHPIITIDELKQRTDSEDYLVIVGSENYCDEIVGELQDKKISAYVCSWYGVWIGIEINIKDKRLPEMFVKDFTARKREWIRVGHSNSNSNEQQCVIYTYQKYLCVHPDAIWIYQPAKVGSMTLRSTFLQEGIDAIHIHRIRHMLMLGVGTQDYIKYPEYGLTETVSEMKKRKKPLKMIVNIREPIARALSNFMQLFSNDFLLYYNNDDGMEENAYKYIEKVLKDDYEFTWWFDEELKAVTGIDVYEYPFDRERGCELIKEDGIEILLLKMEQMDENEEVIGEFVGKPGLRLRNDNVGSQRKYRYIYEVLKKKISLPEDLVKEQYNSRRFKHFYTEEETDRFMKRWIRGQ